MEVGRGSVISHSIRIVLRSSQRNCAVMKQISSGCGGSGKSFLRVLKRFAMVIGVQRIFINRNLLKTNYATIKLIIILIAAQLKSSIRSGKKYAP